jgi:hypothetical protein
MWCALRGDRGSQKKGKHMSTYRVSLAFARLPDGGLDTFTGNVIAKMTGNLSFENPLVSMAALGAARTTFSNAMSAAVHGGKIATSEKNAAREALLGLLRQEAAYVQSIAGEDEPMLLSSGFDTVKIDRTQIQLPQPIVERIENPMSGQLGLKLRPVPTARAYEVQMRYGTNGWEAVGVFTDSRRIIIPDLTPGTVYTLQSRAIGGVTGYSDWSNPVSRMAM